MSLIKAKLKKGDGYENAYFNIVGAYRMWMDGRRKKRV